ncbi:sugar ABC transporter ATP-binding protein [Lacisediminihabitans profunda]|uniref:Sugar ABC transporter ATP-binding protein n=1 Tax=Lacisediminihabitans profunda TaxID=2594790 RepID=A0A5C8ULS4_9MICO|nr:sugar ABC transporter ATP-binding protein [Lacisediminihabitans profunda]TXN28751.1 sugar ABC transporter ATP-binding protein [Lacisediminihabitans profunda]
MTVLTADGVATPVAAPPAPSNALLVVQNLTKHYGPVVAVQDVSFYCLPGEVHALIGENGAGKSTIAKMLAGAVVPTSGSVTAGGIALVSGRIKDARLAGVSCAFQELALVPDWTVAENLALPDGAALRGFSQRKSIHAATALLAGLELDHIDARALVSSLSLADRQFVEIARAITGAPKALILDEASSALGPPGVEWLFRRIRELTALGTSVIYVSHRLSELAVIADRGTVLRDGRVAGEFSRGNWSEDQLISMMAGREASKAFPSSPPLPVSSKPDVLRIENLVAEGLNGISILIKPGEILGVGGLQGHGQRELLRALFGATPASASKWMLGGRPVRRLTPVKAVRLGAGYVPEDRKVEGLALELGVGENLLAPWLKPFQRGGRPRLASEKTWISGVIASLSIRTRGPLENAGALSGGNQQKIVFGRWTDRSRTLILLHDPTRGIDVRAKQELYKAIIELSRQGVGVLWFSTEVEELVNICHRVVVLYEGKIADELEGDRLTAEAVVGAAVGVASPGVSQREIS